MPEFEAKQCGSMCVPITPPYTGPEEEEKEKEKDCDCDCDSDSKCDEEPKGSGGSQPDTQDPKMCSEGEKPKSASISGLNKQFNFLLNIQNLYPGATKCSPAINIANGNLTLDLTQPGGSPNDPRTVLTYNSSATAQTIEYGYGWAGAFNRSVERVSSSVAQVITGDGHAWLYTNRDTGTGIYRQPPGASTALRETSSPAGWIETKPNGLEMTYDDISGLGKIVNIKREDAVWTLAYDTDRLETIVDPAGRLTTYTYDGSNMLQSIIDSAGRTTTFTVDGSGHLTQLVTPELCVTELGYDGSHRLTSYTDPMGNRSTYTYDGNSYVTSRQQANGALTTYGYIDANTATVTDPVGGIITMLFDSERNIIARVSPLGER